MNKVFNRKPSPLLGVFMLAVMITLAACGGVTSTTNAVSQSSPAKAVAVTVPNTAGQVVKATEIVKQKTPVVGTGSTNTNTQAATTATATSADAAGAEGGLAGSGDEPTKVYTDQNGQFSFQYPGSWGKTTQPGETIRLTGRDEFISIAVTTTNLSALDFAKADAAGLTAVSPGYKGSALQAYKVAGTNGAMVAYTWQAGPSPVTGKTVPSSANRYYIPGPGGKLAIFTYSSPTNNYDPAGADDFANAFKWLK